MPTHHRHTCRKCRKSFVTDNAWIWVDRETDTIRAFFCRESCRSEYVARATEVMSAGTNCPMCKCGLTLDAGYGAAVLRCDHCGYRRG